ncbi:stage II sporulation protein M [Catelliglobosispora koreensis]|uniref:stage II sporulation protein M n=1 Tax=Catelliglobosispora koreensis TaxID=129052 RepID=UPI00036042BF|nr:stage II sporulation protein M [Catelliglobosispora koreensis]
MDLDAYVAEHRGEWRRLAYLNGRAKLTASEADELVLLYQRVATQLSVVRSRTPDPSLVAELSRLVLAARAALTGPAKFDWRRLPRYFFRDVPLAFYLARRWWLTLGALFYTVGGIVLVWVANDVTVAESFGLGPDEIDSLVNGAFVGYYSEFFAPSFGLLVWTNNSFIAAMCLASGVLLAPPLFILWNEAVRFGVVGGVMTGAGHGETFFGYLAPHGLLELTAIFVSAGVGMRIAWAWIDPGPILTRAQSLAAAAIQGMNGAVGLVGVLAVSALLEAFVTPAPFPLIIRDMVGLIALLAFFVYVWVFGRAAKAEALETAGGLEGEIGVSDLTRERAGRAV